VSQHEIIPLTGFLRLSQIIGPGNPIPVSKSTWWDGVRSGRFPKPVKLGQRITAWRVDDIRRLIECANHRNAAAETRLRRHTPRDHNVGRQQSDTFESPRTGHDARQAGSAGLLRGRGGEVNS
jgi:prophage regulatory protein